MNNFQTIIIKLKIILQQIHRTKVHDKDLATALSISPSTFASMKRRNSIPYKAILDFCALHHINANILLFNRPVNNFIESPKTIKYYDALEAGGSAFKKCHKDLTLHDLLLLFISHSNRESPQ